MAANSPRITRTRLVMAAERIPDLRLMRATGAFDVFGASPELVVVELVLEPTSSSVG
jgi:hypothetical protein